MAIQLHEVEFETRTIGPLVLTVLVLRRLVVYPTTADNYFAPKPGTMPPTQPVLEGARPWFHTCCPTNSLCWLSSGSSSCCLSAASF
jgi:hypothetical protein